MVSDNFLASSIVFIKAPLPTFTSKTILSAPDANFLLIMLDAISGIDSVVPVTSLKAYIFLSAGTKLPDCDTSDIPISFT